MFEEQEQLGAHTHFTDYLTRVPVDFQLGVITTDIDVDSPGMLVDNTILTRDSSQIASRFANLISLDEGSRDGMDLKRPLPWTIGNQWRCAQCQCRFGDRIFR